MPRLGSVVLSILLFAPGVFAQTASPTRMDVCQQVGTDLPFHKGIKIEILKYEPGTDTFEVNSVRFPGEGNADIVLDALLKSVPKLMQNEKMVRKNPFDIVGEIYELTAPLPTLTEDEKSARKACARKFQ